MQRAPRLLAHFVLSGRQNSAAIAQRPTSAAPAAYDEAQRRKCPAKGILADLSVFSLFCCQKSPGKPWARRHPRH